MSGSLIDYESALDAMLQGLPQVGFSEAAVARPGPTRIFAADLVAGEAYPTFDNAAVDGYAVCSADTRPGVELTVAETVYAGGVVSAPLSPGRATRIMTGAPVPGNTYAVVMQEDVVRNGDRIELKSHVKEGAGVRRSGTEFATGDVLLARGRPLNAGAAGLLAAQGIQQASFYGTVKCGVVVTGDEIVSDGRQLKPGQLRDSVGPMLSRLIAPYAEPTMGWQGDDAAGLTKVLETRAREADAIVVTGGASVGDRDYLAAVIQDIGRIVFHGLSIRPGKPTLFGYVGDTPILGLPGNPASVFVCFQLLGIPMLKRIGGWEAPQHEWLSLPYDAEHEPEPRDVFARAVVRDGRVKPMGVQASFGLRSLACADALAWLPANHRHRAGEPTKCVLLP